MDQAGRFSTEHDGSQDYDMILRLTEKAKHIVHIPRVPGIFAMKYKGLRIRRKIRFRYGEGIRVIPDRENLLRCLKTTE